MSDLIKSPPSRKIRAFIIMVLAISFHSVVGVKFGVPETVLTNGLYAIALGGIFCIGGQSLVDAFKRREEPKP